MTMSISNRKIEEMEAALVHIMYQFRQINRKYGLMVEEELKRRYEKSNDRIMDSIEKMQHISVKY